MDPSHIGRYALGGYVEEHQFLGNSRDVSVDDFVRRHADAVTSTFNEAKNKHMYVLFCLLLKFEKSLSRSLLIYDRRLSSHPCIICLF